MYKATMSDTGEFIVGCTDMVSGILSIVYGCDSQKVIEATETVNRFGMPAIVETPGGQFGFIVTKCKENQQ